MTVPVAHFVHFACQLNLVPHASPDFKLAEVGTVSRHRAKLVLQEIPTFHAQPQTPSCDHWCPFPVADRPNAVRQFFEAAAEKPGLILAPWILLIETDYVWMRPLQNVPAAESSAPGWAFLYGYIMPTYPCTPPSPLRALLDNITICVVFRLLLAYACLLHRCCCSSPVMMHKAPSACSH
jgi:hypothetical protein